MRMLVCEVLQELHYEVIEIADPVAAAPLLASRTRIDLMISDVGMPGMNGRELADIARSRRPELPIPLVTGYAQHATVRAGFPGTNMPMITKPFPLDELAARISELIAGSAAAED